MRVMPTKQLTNNIHVNGFKILETTGEDPSAKDTAFIGILLYG